MMSNGETSVILSPEYSYSLSDCDDFTPFNSLKAIELVDKLADVVDVDDKRNFSLLSTIRYDPDLPLKKIKRTEVQTEDVPNEGNFFLLKLHWQRLVCSLDFFKWNVDISYDHFKSEIIETIKSLDNVQVPYKVRVLVSADNKMKVEAHHVAVRNNIFSGLRRGLTPEEEMYEVYLDTEPSVIGPFTSFKTTSREVYNKARERCLPNTNPNNPKEVVLFNHRGEITEGSITNVAFLRDERWVTPPLHSGCLCGVVRHYLLSRGIIKEEQVMRDDLEVGEPVLLFNGVIGVSLGRVVS